jgi:UDP-glucose 4-epimerase
MKKVIVAGGAGFIGRNCLRPLLDKGYEVHVLDRTDLKEEFPEVFWHEVDLTNQENVDEVVKEIKATHLLSFAWITKHTGILLKTQSVFK